MERTFYRELYDFLSVVGPWHESLPSQVWFSVFFFFMGLHMNMWSKNNVTLFVIAQYHKIIKIGSYEPYKNRYMTILFAVWVSFYHFDQWPFQISHHLVMFSGHRSYASRDITSFLCHVWCDYVIEKTRDFVVCGLVT